MQQTPGDTVPAEGLPRHTTPTWEVELLISGVAVFAMLQLPGWMDDQWFALAPRLDASWFKLFELVYLYAKSAALILSATFVLHLLLRARWIAYVGMHSVYPDGVRWERLRSGPVQTEVEQHQYGNIEDAIERADNRATMVFAVGVSLASLLLLITGLLVLAFFAGQFASRGAGQHWDVGRFVFALLAFFIVPLFVFSALDRRYGHRLHRTDILRRFLVAGFRFYGRLGIGRGSNPTFALIGSNGGRLRLATMILLSMGLATTAALLSYLRQRDPSALGQYELFPRLQPSTGRSLDASYYDDTRNPSRDNAMPYVQSAVIVGPYLKLVVPYQPTADGRALALHCPAVVPAATAVARLDCLQQLHTVLLDGQPIQALRYDTGSDPRTDRPALVAMLDIRALARGRHVLQVAHPPDTGKSSTSGADLIPFWH